MHLGKKEGFKGVKTEMSVKMVRFCKVCLRLGCVFHTAFYGSWTVLDYLAQRVFILGFIYAYDPYLGTTWVFTEEISAFPRNNSTDIYESPQD